MNKGKLLKVASVVLPIVCGVIGIVSDRINEQQRRVEIEEEINEGIERRFTERFGTIENEEVEELY